MTGSDWPGRTIELAAGFADDTPAQRRAVLVATDATSAEGQSLVLRALRDADGTVRRTAASVAARGGIEAAAPALGDWLSDPDPVFRAAGAMALGALHAREQLPGLVRALGDTDVTVRLRAIEAVVAIDSPDAALPLMDRVADPESAVRIAAVRALGDLGDTRAIFALLGALQDPMPDVRRSSARALGLLGDARAVPALVALLRDPTGDVRLAAAHALGTLGPVAEPAVSDLAAAAFGEDTLDDAVGQRVLARAAVESLGRVGGPRAAEILVEVFRRSELDPDVAMAAGRAMDVVGAPAHARIAELSALPIAPTLAAPLVETLGSLGGESAADALVTLLDSPLPPATHDAAVRALGRTGAPSAVIRLLTLAAVVPTVAVRTVPSPLRRGVRRDGEAADPGHAALEGLLAWAQRRGGLDPLAVDPLAALLASAPVEDSTEVPARWALVARLLGETRNPRATGVLARLLTATDPRVRSAAAEGMRLAGVDGVEDRVAAALSDPSAETRLAAADALARHGGTAALGALVARWNSQAPVDRVSVARAVGRITLRTKDFRAVPWLLEAVQGGGDELAGAALDALADATAAGSQPARQALIASLDDPSLRDASAQALGNAMAEAPASVRAELTPLLTDLARGTGEPSVRAAAAWALGDAMVPALPTLTALVSDPRTAVAVNAAGALARMALRTAAPIAAEHEVLCTALAAHRHPLARANLILALGRAGVVCANVDLGHTLRTARSPWVRRAAAEAMGVGLHAGGDPATMRSLRSALARCAVDDVAEDIAARCGVLLTAEGDAPRELDTIDAVVTYADASVGAGRTYGVVLDDGVAVMGTTGPAGWVHFREVVAGRWAAVDPSSMLWE